MESQWIAFLTVVVAIVVSHAMLHRDLAAVREGLAKLEGTVEGFIAGFRPGRTRRGRDTDRRKPRQATPRLRMKPATSRATDRASPRRGQLA